MGTLLAVYAIITVAEGADWGFPKAFSKEENTVWSRIRFDDDPNFKLGRWTLLMNLSKLPRQSTCEVEVWLMAPDAPHYLLSPGAAFCLISSNERDVKGRGVVCEHLSEDNTK